MIPVLLACRVSMIVLRPAAAGSPRVMLWLRPQRTLSRRGLRRLIAVLVLLVLSTAVLGAWQGNVFAPLFALVESVAVTIALGVAWRAGDRSERITLDDVSLEVRCLPGRQCVRFQSAWVRVRLEEGDNGCRRLLLSSHGREWEIGRFLAEQERAELLRKLKLLLDGVNNQRRG